VDQPIQALIEAAERGDKASAEQLFAALYSELHRMAQRELAKQHGPSTLGATTLLHEAYLDMAARHGPSFPDRARFMGYAAKVMRGLIIDHVRSRLAQKRGGQFELTTFTGDVAASVPDSRELEKIGDALDELAEADPELAQIVDLRFFCGFSFDEIAAMRGVSGRTVQRMWEKARIYLHRTLRSDLPS
jgi:RNA polymerase sigma factor (TIGR02999 family)